MPVWVKLCILVQKYDWFFTTMKTVDQMLEKEMYLAGTVMKSRVIEAQQKLPRDQPWNSRKTCLNIGYQGDGEECFVRWYDSKPILMLSSVLAEQSKDMYQRWSKAGRQICEYISKMGGVVLVNRMMNYYQMRVQTKKWTIWMLTHFTVLALANSWLLFLQDKNEHGTTSKDIMQFLEFHMAVAQVYLNKCGTDLEQVQEENAYFFGKKKKKPHQVSPVPQVSVHITFQSFQRWPNVLQSKRVIREILCTVCDITCSYACKLNAAVLEHFTQANRYDRLFLQKRTTFSVLSIE